MRIHQIDNKPCNGPHILDNPPQFYEKLCDDGERPYWSPDGKKLAFIERNYGDICEIDMETEAGYDMGLGFLDLEAWEKSEYARQWGTPESRAAQRAR